MKKVKVLVAGATGYLGRYLVKELKKRGYWVRVLIRKKEQAQLFDSVDDCFIGKVTEAESLRGITKDIDWFFSTIGITRQKDGLSYMDVDYQGNANLLAAALHDEVHAFQYVSAINGDKMKHLAIFKAKERFVDELKLAPIQSCIMRPNGFFSDMRDFLEMAKRGKVYLFGDGQYKLNPIDGEDLAVICVDKMEDGEKEASVGGPVTLSQNELAQLALKAWHNPPRVVHLPDWIRKCSIWLLRTFTSVKTYGPIEFFLTAMATDNIAPNFGNKKLDDFFTKEVARMKAQ